VRFLLLTARLFALNVQWGDDHGEPNIDCASVIFHGAIVPFG
jgi:hypothetical protein